MQPQDTGKKIGGPVAKIAHSINSAVEASNVGRSSIYEAIKNGELRAHKLGTRTLILDDDLRRWVASLPLATTEAA